MEKELKIFLFLPPFFWRGGVYDVLYFFVFVRLEKKIGIIKFIIGIISFVRVIAFVPVFFSDAGIIGAYQ